VVGRIRFALERFDSPRHSSHVAQLWSLGIITCRINKHKPMKIILSLILIASLLLTGCSSIPSQKMAGVAPNERHSTSPRHFWFDYPSQPSPGKRYWTAVGQTWIEQYESGFYSRFTVVGRTTIEGILGSVVVQVSAGPDQTWKVNEGDFQAFIPDVGSTQPQFWFRHKTNGEWQDWHPLAEMQDIE